MDAGKLVPIQAGQATHLFHLLNLGQKIVRSKPAPLLTLPPALRRRDVNAK